MKWKKHFNLIKTNKDASRTKVIEAYPQISSKLHRKKDSNTLYTINSLNALIRNLNGGVLDNKYAINWDDYKNMLLLVDGDSYKVINTKLFKIFKI